MAGLDRRDGFPKIRANLLTRVAGANLREPRTDVPSRTGRLISALLQAGQLFKDARHFAGLAG